MSQVTVVVRVPLGNNEKMLGEPIKVFATEEAASQFCVGQNITSIDRYYYLYCPLDVE